MANSFSRKSTTKGPLYAGLLLFAAIPGLAGELEDPRLTEASGLARSQRSADTYWLINDSGHGAWIYAMNSVGKHRGAVEIDSANNRDWEDLASFSWNGQPMLLIADIGDNLGLRRTLQLYVLEEPPIDAETVNPAWTHEFRLAGGAADAEAIAVDPSNGDVLLLTKRDIPARLYRTSLKQSGQDISTAEHVAVLTTLPQPTEEDLASAVKRKSWHWQPTAMDISPDGGLLAILTYRRVYFYPREHDESWADAVGRAPLAAEIGGLKEAEALAFSADGQSVYVTIEKKHAPVLRIQVPQQGQ